MRISLLFLALAVLVRGEEPDPPSAREKLRAKILASLPPPAARPLVSQPVNPAAATPPVMMQPVIVADSNRALDRAAAAIARKEQQEKAEKFTPIKGGTLYTKEAGGYRVTVGSWWNPGQGWSFLHIDF